MLLCDILSMNMIRSGCELEEENVDGEYSAFLLLENKEVESFTGISENTESEEEIIECIHEE